MEELDWMEKLLNTKYPNSRLHAYEVMGKNFEKVVEKLTKGDSKDDGKDDGKESEIDNDNTTIKAEIK